MANLICDDLCMTFTNPQTGGKVEALKDINFTLKKGELLAVLGPSGCGKTTLAESILQLIPDAQGEVFFKDKNGEIHTPIPDCFLDGITRRTVIEIAKSKNIKVHERKINPSELSNFVGCFLTGTAAEVTPVSCIAENQFKVCETIIDLNESYQALVRKKKAA